MKETLKIASFAGKIFTQIFKHFFQNYIISTRYHELTYSPTYPPTTHFHLMIHELEMKKIEREQKFFPPKKFLRVYR